MAQITLESALQMIPDLKERVARLESSGKIAVVQSEGKNRSSALNREMTNDDARRALNGDLRAMSHKEAADQMGLTYAQVYACRLGYTFKHIHK